MAEPQRGHWYRRILLVVATFAVAWLATAEVRRGVDGRALRSTAQANAERSLRAGGPPPLPDLTARRVVEGLAEPVSVRTAPGDPFRLYIVEKPGRIRIFDLNTLTLLPEPFLDLTTAVRSLPIERGMLDVAFDPAYEFNGRLYVSYTADVDGALRLSRFNRTGDPDVIDPSTELIMKQLPQSGDNHFGGSLQFGLDNLLYFSTGDGFLVSDGPNRAQNPMEPYGKILRLNPAAPPPYVPFTNPYVGDPNGRDDVWAVGLRNPWRTSFDPVTGNFYVADVGREAREEISVIRAGVPAPINFGWRCMEGTLCTGLTGCICNEADLTLPVLDLDHAVDNTCAVVGGYTYRGNRIPGLQGRYFFGDFCGGYIRSFRLVNGAAADIVDHTEELDPWDEISQITSFGVDALGELYIATRGGTIWRIEVVGDCNDNDIPDDEEVLLGLASDCNQNRRPDACDVMLGLAPDCNDNGIPDPCDFGAAVDLASGALGPIASGSTQTFSVPNVDPTTTDVLLTFLASADLGTPDRSIDVSLNGVPIGTIFTDGAGSSCADPADTDQILVDGGLFNILTTSGSFDITLTPSAAMSPFACSGQSTAEIVVRYQAFSDQLDCDGNGVLDSCEIADGQADDENRNGILDVCEDCNDNSIPDWVEIKSDPAKDLDGNGLPDECEDCNDNGLPDGLDIEQGTSVDIDGDGLPDECDCNGNGVADKDDIAEGTSSDDNGNNTPDECETPGDVTGDGLVDVEDLLAMVNQWGLCPPVPIACPADLDGTLRVDAEDVLLLINNWTP